MLANYKNVSILIQMVSLHLQRASQCCFLEWLQAQTIRTNRDDHDIPPCVFDIVSENYLGQKVKQIP